jgi:hypothetical protein
LATFEKNTDRADRGSAKLKATYDALHISTKNNEQALREAFTALSKVIDAQQRFDAASTLFGQRGAKIVLGVIAETNGNLDEAIAKYKQLGTLIDTETATAAARFSDELKTLEMQIAGMAREVGMTLMPMVENAVTSLSHWIQDNREKVVEWAQTFASAVQGLWAVVGPIVSALGQSLSSLGALMKAFQGDASAFKWKAAQFSQSLVPHVPTDDLTKEEQDFVDAEVEGKTLPVAGGNLGMSGASALANALNKPKVEPPKLPSLAKTPHIAKPKKGPNEFGQQLLDQLQEQLSGVTEKTKLAEIATQLLQKRYEGLGNVLKTHILAVAAQIDLQKEKDKQDKEETRLTDQLRAYVDKQAESVHNLFLGQKDNYTQGEALIDSLKRQGLQVRDSTADLIHLNNLLLDIGASMKALEKLKLPPDLDRFGAGPSGEKGTDEGLAKQILDSLGGELPPAMAKEIDLFDAFGKKMAETFGLGAEQAQEFGSILANVFDSVGNAVGGVIENFVKFGTAGLTFRKFVSEVIAGVAAEAGVKAVFELAEGFASLFLNPPKAAAHFHAAALYGSISAVAAVAGRAIAGNAFQDPQRSRAWLPVR